MHNGNPLPGFRRLREASRRAPQRRDLGAWSSFEALAESAGRHRAGLGRHLGLSRSLVDRWCQSWSDDHDGGARNPLDRLEEWTEFLRREGEPECRCILPILWLADRLGYRLEVEGGEVHAGSPAAGAGRLAAEVGDVVQATLDALEDGTITPLERQAIGKELREAEIALADLKHKLSVGAASCH